MLKNKQSVESLFGVCWDSPTPICLLKIGPIEIGHVFKWQDGNYTVLTAIEPIEATTSRHNACRLLSKGTGISNDMSKEIFNYLDSCILFVTGAHCCLVFKIDNKYVITLRDLRFVASFQEKDEAITAAIAFALIGSTTGFTVKSKPVVEALRVDAAYYVTCFDFD